MSRSIFIVRLIQQIPGLEGYDALQSDYWAAVKAQMDRQSLNSGRINHIFIETVTGRGEDASIQLRQLSPSAHSLAMGLVTSGAVIQEFEDRDLLAEIIDWQRCAAQELVSSKVRNIVSSGYLESSGLRDEHLKKRLNDTVKENDNALVLAASEQLPIPDRVERFIVSPPELDRLERWLRNKMEEARLEMMARMEREASQQAGTGPTSEQQSSSSGLWTPP